jgi:phage terminase large subunit-like protein
MSQNKKPNKVGDFTLAEQKQLFQAGRHSLMDFSILADPYGHTDKNYKPNWHHRIIAQELEHLIDDSAEWKILVLQMPPRHGKSQLASINFPAYYLGRRPEREIITVSYSADLAIDFGSKTRDLVSSPQYGLIFPEVKLKSDEQSKSKWKTNAGGSYTSTGVGGPITGRGADCLLVDDPLKNREEAESKVIRDKVWDWFLSTAYTRLSPNGRIVIILTRWHLDDLVGRLQQNKEFNKGIKLISFPAIATEDEKFRKKGEALWESRFPLAELESTKLKLGITNFNSLYQQSPIISENQEFKTHWFTERTWQDVCYIKTRNYLTVDTAISKSASADYTGIVSNFVDKEGKWNVKVKQLKLNPKELIDLLFTLNDEDGYEAIGIEKTIYYDAIKPFLDDEMRKRGKYLNIVPLEHRQLAKETRIRGLIPRYESRSIIHIKDECGPLVEELLSFPRGAHDDVLDSLGYMCQIAETPDTVQDSYDVLSYMENEKEYRQENMY